MSEPTYTKEECLAKAWGLTAEAARWGRKADNYKAHQLSAEKGAAHWKQLAAEIEAKEAK